MKAIKKLSTLGYTELKWSILCHSENDGDCLVGDQMNDSLQVLSTSVDCDVLGVYLN